MKLSLWGFSCSWRWGQTIVINLNKVQVHLIKLLEKEVRCLYTQALELLGRPWELVDYFLPILVRLFSLVPAWMWLHDDYACLDQTSNIQETEDVTNMPAWSWRVGRIQMLNNGFFQCYLVSISIKIPCRIFYSKISKIIDFTISFSQRLRNSPKAWPDWLVGFGFLIFVLY